VFPAVTLARFHIPDNTNIDPAFESAGVSTPHHHDDLQDRDSLVSIY